MDENTRWQKLAAEFLGTAFLVFVGVGSVPALLLVNEANGSTFSGSDLGIISLAFATIVIVTVYVFGYISGNHINPAVTFGLAATGKFPWSEVPSYLAAQVSARSPAPSRSWACWARPVTSGSEWRRTATRSLVPGLLRRVHRHLLAGLRGLRRDLPQAAPGWAGLSIGMVVFAAIIPVAPTTGASINPARTTGPMLVQQIMGGSVKWDQWPVYVAAELLAGVAAALLFGLVAHTREDTAPAAAPATVPAAPVPAEV
jgi:glycerol uptake facilitator protein